MYRAECTEIAHLSQKSRLRFCNASPDTCAIVFRSEISRRGHWKRPGTPEESEKSPERVPLGSAPKVPKECAPESRKSPKRVRKSDFRLFSGSFETPGRTLWALLGPCSGVLFPDSFRGFRARRGWETLCGAGSIATLVLQCFWGGRTLNLEG